MDAPALTCLSPALPLSAARSFLVVGQPSPCLSAVYPRGDAALTAPDYWVLLREITISAILEIRLLLVP